MNRVSIGVHRALGAALAARRGGQRRLDAAAPARILAGDDVHDARVHLVGLAGMLAPEGAAAVAHTGHGALELATSGAPVRYRLDERGEVSVEFGNGFLLMANARLAGTSAMQLTPLRRDLAPLSMLLVPVGRSRQ